VENELPDLKLPEFPTPAGIHDDHTLRGGRNVHKRKQQKNRTYQNPGWAQNIMQPMSNVEKSSQGLVHVISVDEI